MTGRRKRIKGKQIEEFYWHGKFVVYVDNKLSERTFEEEVKIAEEEAKDA